MPETHQVGERTRPLFRRNRYCIEPSIGWAICDSESNNEIVLEVTSEGYAMYLCRLLNSGATLQEIEERPAPDLEFFDAMITMYTD